MSTSWSYSAFSTAITCLRKYRLVYVDKLAPDYKSGDLEFGSALHAALNGELHGEDGESLFLVYWATYKDKDLQYGRYKWGELENLGVQFISKFKKAYLKRFDEIKSAEVRLYGEYRGVKLEGTLDLLAEFDGRTTLVDFKTSGARYEPEKTKVSLQLYLYSYLALTNFKIKIDQIMYLPFLKSTGGIQNPVIEEFREADMYAALDEAVDYINTISFGQFAVSEEGVHDFKYPRNFNACLGYGRKCEFWSKCHGGEEK